MAINVNQLKLEVIGDTSRADNSLRQLDGSMRAVEGSGQRGAASAQNLAGALTGIEGPAGRAAGQMLGVNSSVAALAGAGGPIIALTALVGGLATAAFQLGAAWDDATDRIRIGTGATGTALRGLQEDLSAVYTSVPGDLKTASQVIADLNTRLGLTGEPLRQLGVQLLEFSRLTGTDAVENVRLLTRTYGDWGIATEDQSEALDKLFRASQVAGASTTQLQTLLVQYGAPLRQLGISFDEATALLGKFEKEGVNTELVMGSLRIAIGNLAAAGIPLESGIQDVITKIRDMEDASAATALAIQTFGARAGPDMAAAIREGRFEIDLYLDAIQNTGESVQIAAADTDDAAQRMEKSWKQVQLAATPAGEAVFIFGDILATAATGPVAEFAASLNNIARLFKLTGEGAITWGQVIGQVAQDVGNLALPGLDTTGAKTTASFGLGSEVGDLLGEIGRRFEARQNFDGALLTRGQAAQNKQTAEENWRIWSEGQGAAAAPEIERAAEQVEEEFDSAAALLERAQNDFLAGFTRAGADRDIGAAATRSLASLEGALRDATPELRAAAGQTADSLVAEMEKILGPERGSELGRDYVDAVLAALAGEEGAQDRARQIAEQFATEAAGVKAGAQSAAEAKRNQAEQDKAVREAERVVKETADTWAKANKAIEQGVRERAAAVEDAEGKIAKAQDDERQATEELLRTHGETRDIDARRQAAESFGQTFRSMDFDGQQQAIEDLDRSLGDRASLETRRQAMEEWVREESVGYQRLEVASNRRREVEATDLQRTREDRALSLRQEREDSEARLNLNRRERDFSRSTGRDRDDAARASLRQVEDATRSYQQRVADITRQGGPNVGAQLADAARQFGQQQADAQRQQGRAAEDAALRIQRQRADAATAQSDAEADRARRRAQEAADLSQRRGEQNADRQRANDFADADFRKRSENETSLKNYRGALERQLQVDRDTQSEQERKRQETRIAETLTTATDAAWAHVDAVYERTYQRLSQLFTDLEQQHPWISGQLDVEQALPRAFERPGAAAASGIGGEIEGFLRDLSEQFRDPTTGTAHSRLDEIAANTKAPIELSDMTIARLAEILARRAPTVITLDGEVIARSTTGFQVDDLRARAG